MVTFVNVLTSWAICSLWDLNPKAENTYKGNWKKINQYKNYCILIRGNNHNFEIKIIAFYGYFHKSHDVLTYFRYIEYRTLS